MRKELPKTYDPHSFEDRIYQTWCEKNYFAPDPDESKPPFSVVTKPADAPEGRQRLLAERRDALFTLCCPTPKAAGELYRRTPCMVD